MWVCLRPLASSRCLSISSVSRSPLVDVPRVCGRGVLGYLRADRAPTGVHSKCE